MAMDVLRSAHTVPARVGSDNEAESQLRWYKCKPGAKAFPGFHAFGSAVWEPHPDEWTQGPGVKTGPLAWAKKDIVTPPGIEYHGQMEWYQKGIPQSVLDNPEPHKSPTCFPPPLPLGVVAGMSARKSGLIFGCPGIEPPTVLPNPLIFNFDMRTGEFLTVSSYTLPPKSESLPYFLTFNQALARLYTARMNHFVFFDCIGGVDKGVRVTVRQSAYGSSNSINSITLSDGWSLDGIWTTATSYSAVKFFPYSDLDLSMPLTVGVFSWMINGITSGYTLSIS